MFNEIVCNALEIIFGIWIVCQVVEFLFEIDVIETIRNLFKKIANKRGDR